MAFIHELLNAIKQVKQGEQKRVTLVRGDTTVNVYSRFYPHHDDIITVDFVSNQIKEGAQIIDEDEGDTEN